MFPSNQSPAPGARESARPDRRLVPGRPDPMEPRGSISVLGVSTRALVPAALARPGASTAEVAGTVTTARPIAPVAVALVSEAGNPGAPAVLPVPLVPAGPGRYAYTLPLDLPADQSRAHRYAVTVVVRDSEGTANASALFAAPANPARPAHPRPAGHAR